MMIPIQKDFIRHLAKICYLHSDALPSDGISATVETKQVLFL